MCFSGECPRDRAPTPDSRPCFRRFDCFLFLRCFLRGVAKRMRKASNFPALFGRCNGSRGISASRDNELSLSTELRKSANAGRMESPASPRDCGAALRRQHARRARYPNRTAPRLGYHFESSSKGSNLARVLFNLLNYRIQAGIIVEEILVRAITDLEIQGVSLF